MAVISGDTLDGVSATTLWTLHNRGTEAKRSDGVIRDPWAATLFDTIEYDYRKFGKPNQSHGLRAAAFDGVMRAHLTAHPKASVVALAEGLQTSFWRLDEAGVADELTLVFHRFAARDGVARTTASARRPHRASSPSRPLTAAGWTG